MACIDLITLKLSNFIECGISTSHIYVGITTDLERRLFQEHKVDKETNDWICAKCSSSNVARKIEKELIGKYQTKGDVGGGDDSADIIYAYKLTSATNPGL